MSQDAQPDLEGMQNFWRRATSHLKIVKLIRLELLNNLLITLSPSYLDDAYSLDPLLRCEYFQKTNSFFTLIDALVVVTATDNQLNQKKSDRYLVSNFGELYMQV